MSCEFCKGAVRIVAAAWHDDTRLNPDGKPKSINAKVCPECGEPLTEPEPLTLEQLRQMDGELVYIREGDSNQFWAVIAIDDNNIILYSPDYDGECPDEDFYAMYYDLDPDGHFGLHVLGWLAYTRKPKDGRAGE